MILYWLNIFGDKLSPW